MGNVVSTVRDLRTDTAHRVAHRYLVAADGAASPIREALGIEMDGPPVLQRFVSCAFEADLTKTRATLMECESGDRLDVEYNSDWDYHIFRVRTVIDGKHDKFHWKMLVHPQTKTICGNVVEFHRYVLGINVHVVEMNNINIGGLFNDSSCLDDPSAASANTLPDSHD